jgi:thiol-disulfide isomerase/thioredoxin
MNSPEITSNLEKPHESILTMKKSILITATTSLTLAATLFAGPAGDIATKHAAASAAELETYLTKNPTAEDKAEAIEHLVSAYSLTGNNKRTSELMRIKFDAIEGGAKLDPGELYMTTQMLFQSLVDAGDKEGAKKLIAAATEKSKGHQEAQKLTQAFSQMAGSLNVPGVGDTMEINFKSLQDEDIDLAKMKGKVVLVDFWATWCGPCIAELPNVQETYAKHHDKGFEVIAISLDKDEDKLKKFIEDKKMPWAQYFDGKGWGNEISTGFGIKGIPATFLIGTDGKIVATNLRGANLEKAVAKALAKE